jgi:hypothetical protein
MLEVFKERTRGLTTERRQAVVQQKTTMYRKGAENVENYVKKIEVLYRETSSPTTLDSILISVSSQKPTTESKTLKPENT